MTVKRAPTILSPKKINVHGIAICRLMLANFIFRFSTKPTILIKMVLYILKLEKRKISE